MNNPISVFLIGGSVRDKLLFKPSSDNDFVVVGATPEEMLANGFTQVGQHFPVFLHPLSKDEFALARTERKTVEGHQGFETVFDPSVTLEEDVLRRDITINTLCLEVHTDILKTGKIQFIENKIIDYHNGQEDLNNKVLKHTSEAFKEDPLRVLRVARFAARYNFTVADETMELMAEIVEDGGLETISGERIYKEFSRAMMEPNPINFLTILDAIGGVDVLFSEIFSEVISDTLNEEKGLALSKSTLLNRSMIDRLIILCAWQNPTKIGEMLNRLYAPNDIKAHVLMAVRFLEYIKLNPKLESADDFDILLEEINGWKTPSTFLAVANALSLIANAHIENMLMLSLMVLRVGEPCFAMLSNNQQKTLTGKAITEALKVKRLEMVKEVL